METTADVTIRYLELTQLPLRKFAASLTQSIKAEITHASVQYWSRGKTEPSTDFLLCCVVGYSDWRREFALAALKCKLPEVFGDGALARILQGVEHGK